MKVACIQFNVKLGEVDQNYERVETLIRQAASEGAELVVLPELWNTGYVLQQLNHLADVNGERTKSFLSALAAELQLHIVGGSVAIQKNSDFYNMMYVANNKGEIVSEYAKVHLFRLMDEEIYLKSGKEMNRFTLAGMEAAGVICYDIRFPEWLRSHALDGAKVIFVSAQWPTPRIDHWKTLLQARAIENQCFIVAVNRTADDVESFNGQSMIIEPWGDIVWTGNEHQELAIVDVDFSLVDEIRARIPVYEDRRPTLYNGVTK